MGAAGFADVTSADGNVSDLARLVAARLQPAAPLLYLAGEDRSGDLAGDLRTRGFAVETTMIYRAIAATGLPPAAADALASGIDGVLHFSRRSAEAYVDAARAAGMLAKRAKTGPFLSFGAGRGTAGAGRRRRHPCRGASKRGRIARAYCRGLICCRRLCPVLCRGDRPYLIGLFGDRAPWELHDSEPDSTPRRRPPTIDLTATEVEAEKPARPAQRAGRDAPFIRPTNGRARAGPPAIARHNGGRRDCGGRDRGRRDRCRALVRWLRAAGPAAGIAECAAAEQRGDCRHRGAAEQNRRRRCNPKAVSAATTRPGAGLSFGSRGSRNKIAQRFTRRPHPPRR